jgi:hypothetical protein
MIIVQIGKNGSYTAQFLDFSDYPPGNKRLHIASSTTKHRQSDKLSWHKLLISWRFAKSHPYIMPF